MPKAALCPCVFEQRGPGAVAPRSRGRLRFSYPLKLRLREKGLLAPDLRVWTLDTGLR